MAVLKRAVTHGLFLLCDRPTHQSNTFYVFGSNSSPLPWSSTSHGLSKSIRIPKENRQLHGNVSRRQQDLNQGITIAVNFVRVRNFNFGEWVTQVAGGRARELIGVEGTEEYFLIGFVFYRSTNPETSPSVENTGQHPNKNKFGVVGMDREGGGPEGGAPRRTHPF